MALQITALTGKDETWRRKAKGGWKNLCTQHFLRAEYQWRTTTHRQPIKASFHSLTFPLTAALTASLTGGSDNKKTLFKSCILHFCSGYKVWECTTISWQTEKLLIHHKDIPQLDRSWDRSRFLHIFIAAALNSVNVTVGVTKCA